MSIQLFSIKFQPLSWHDVQDRLNQALHTRADFRITTVNPEYLLEARSNARFRTSLQNAHVRLVDGFGIVLIARLRGQKLYRLTGADILPKLLAWAEQEKLPVAIWNQPTGLSSQEDIVSMLTARYPALRVSYNSTPSEYALVLCTYGAPIQELFLDTLSEPGIKIGIGGALDFLTGRQRRAPYIVRCLGFEWLWRLCWQPRRLGRIWRAVVVFPLQGIMELVNQNKKK